MKLSTVVVVLSAFAGSALAADATDPIAAGGAVFTLRCAPCHGAGRGGDPGRELLPGTDALRIKYKGTNVPALLEQRTDLPQAALKAFVRNGSWSMPPFRKTEVSDADIAAIAAYLASTSRAAGR